MKKSRNTRGAIELANRRKADQWRALFAILIVKLNGPVCGIQIFSSAESHVI